MTRIYEGRRPAPQNVITEGYVEDIELGVLKRGKEADVWLVERRAGDRTCLLAAKRYVQPEDRAFRNTMQYRSHRTERGMVRDGGDLRRRSETREDRAMRARSQFGKEQVHNEWIDNEWVTMRRLYEAGVQVPYAVERLGDGTLMQYVGDAEYAAPRLANARVERRQLPDLYEQLRGNLRAMLRAGIVHGDLSAYNILLWEDRLWIIDLPQAVPYLDNLSATDFLHRDVTNIGGWFARRGFDVDPEDLFVDLLTVGFDYRMEDMFNSHGS